MTNTQGTRLRRPSLLAIALIALIATGCAAPPPIETLRVAPDRYHEAFDRAVDAARAQGMMSSVRDRRRGVIEAGPSPSPSLLEPWRPATSFERRIDQTISYERRRARFEFSPAGAEPGAETSDSLSGPDVLAVGVPVVDRTTYGGPLELHVRVYVEQSHKPGLRPDTWSRARTTQAIEYDESGRPRPAVFWTPVARDPGLERVLLAAIEEAMATSSDAMHDDDAATVTSDS